MRLVLLVFGILFILMKKQIIKYTDLEKNNYFIFYNFLILYLFSKKLFYIFFTKKFKKKKYKPFNNFVFYYFQKKKKKKYFLKNFIFFKKRVSLLKRFININFDILQNNYKYSRRLNKLTKKKNFKKRFKWENQKLKLHTKKKLMLYFRNNRKVFNFFFYKKVYNIKHFKKIFFSFSKFSQYNLVKNFELLLYNIVLKSQFALSYKDSIYLIKNGFIYVNGCIKKNPFFVLKLYDLIQVPIFYSFYRYFKNKNRYFKKFIFKFRRKMIRFYRSKRRFFMIKTRQAPKKIQRVTHYKLKVPSFLEVDFLTMVSVIVYLPFKIKFFNYYFLKYIPIYLNKLYSWKLLT